MDALRGAGVLAARGARDRLARAMTALREAGAPPDSAVSGATAELARVVGLLYGVEAANAEGVLAALRSAMDALAIVLATLQSARWEDPALDVAIGGVARTMAILHPAERELAHVLEEEPEPEAIPLAKPRSRAAPPPDERRVAARHTIEADIGLHSETNFYAGFAGDVSDGGIFVATYQLMPIGTDLTVSFVLPDGHQVTAPGVVRWVRETGDSDNPPGMGIAFRDLYAADRGAIARFLSQRPPLFYDD
jgi:uncharacterized protein (TIGR02266 family)